MKEQLKNSRRKSATFPLPREHGAWVMLLAPQAISLASLPRINIATAIVLLATSCSILVLREAWVRTMKATRGPSEFLYLAAFSLASLTGAAKLLIESREGFILPIVAAVVAAFAFFAILPVISSRRRLDRTLPSEIVAASAMALTAPVAMATQPFSNMENGWLIWLLCMLFFTSGILVVNMLLSAARSRNRFKHERWRMAAPALIFHSLLALSLFAFASLVVKPFALFVFTAYLPALARAAFRIIKLSNKMPAIKPVGYMEAALSLWFVGFCIVAFRHC